MMTNEERGREYILSKIERNVGRNERRDESVIIRPRNWWW
jgi:hypothetical protein